MSDLNSKILDLAEQCRFDPVRWAEVAWDWGHGALKNHKGPRQWQRDINEIILDHLQHPDTRYEPLKIAVASGHGIGKSAEFGMLVNWALSTCVDTKVVVTANTLPQLSTKTIPEISRWTKTSITGGFFDCFASNIAARSATHAKDWRCDFVTWSEHNTEAFAGLHNQGRRIVVIFDEASKIADKVWEVAEGALTDEQTEIIWIAFGNPTQNTGMFRECFRKNKHRWVTRQIDSRTVEGVNKKQIEKWVVDHGEDSDFVKVRVRGMFPNVSAKQFIATTDADSALKKVLRSEEYMFAPKILSCDPAWEGDDPLVIGLRQGLNFKVLRSIAKNDNDFEVATLLTNLEDEHQADAVFVDAGFGTGVVSAGKQMGRDWQLVWFGAGSSDAGCLNKRSEIWKAMRDWLKEGGSINGDNDLYYELIGPELVSRLDGKLQIEKKSDMKKRGLPSPNRADCLAMTFAAPVDKKVARALTHSSGAQANRQRGHNPFKRGAA